MHQETDRKKVKMWEFNNTHLFIKRWKQSTLVIILPVFFLISESCNINAEPWLKIHPLVMLPLNAVKQDIKTSRQYSSILRATLYCVGLKYVIKTNLGNQNSHVLNVSILTFLFDRICRVLTLDSCKDLVNYWQTYMYLTCQNIFFSVCRGWTCIISLVNMFANKTLKIWPLFLGLWKGLLYFQVLSF